MTDDIPSFAVALIGASLAYAIGHRGERIAVASLPWIILGLLLDASLSGSASIELIDNPAHAAGLETAQAAIAGAFGGAEGWLRQHVSVWLLARAREAMRHVCARINAGCPPEEEEEDTP